ncbi:MAG: class I SAM-dependent methyltransferase [Bryobacterales bacterium]|nr:class I SAM-dependent methyltransferase [Bryobacterales bacterium]
MSSYREDLAYINDAGFSNFTAGATPGVLALLRRHGVPRGLVVDLGCGSGRFSSALTSAGYSVLGVDQSPAMIRMAKKNAPQARFLTGSLYGVEIPPCDAVTAIGEIVNYQFAPKQSRASLTRLFRRVHKALRPGGLFVFDVAEPGRVPPFAPEQYWEEGPDWALRVEVDGNAYSRWLTRKIVCFRRNSAGLYRRSDELHRLRLFHAEDVQAELASLGFQTRVQSGYGRFRLYPGLRAIVAQKTPAPAGLSR